MYAYNGTSIILIGTKTTVHHNCTDGNSNAYGLKTYGSSATIQLVSPLSKEQVSINNGGGGNWGAYHGGDINQIKTIDASAISFSSSSVVAAAAPVSETKSIH